MDKSVISLLIDRFFAGETSPAEEREIYAYFASVDDAGELERYRPMFGWYEGLSGHKPMAVPRSRRRRWLAVAGVAAAVALAVGISFTFFTPADRVPDDLYAVYQGSYVMRDGKRVTDISRIYNDLVKAEALADSLGRLDSSKPDEAIEESLVDNALRGISDPELAAQIRRDILGNS